MIASFRHRGLRRLYETGDGREVQQDQLKRIRRILSVLDNAKRVDDIDQLPGMRLHPLKGDLAGFWSVSISGNWRIVFRFKAGDAFDVDLVDYH
jgi:proteic killer suppression protein